MWAVTKNREGAGRKGDGEGGGGNIVIMIMTAGSPLSVNPTITFHLHQDHSLCFAIWCFNIYNQSVHSGFSKNPLCMWVHQSTLPHFCPRSGYGHQTGTMFPYTMADLKKVSDEIFMTTDILNFSICHFWVLLNQGLYPKDMFFGNCYAIRPPWSSSFNVLVPGLDYLKHLKAAALDKDWAPKQCSKLWKHSCIDFAWQ